MPPPSLVSHRPSAPLKPRGPMLLYSHAPTEPAVRPNMLAVKDPDLNSLIVLDPLPPGSRDLGDPCYAARLGTVMDLLVAAFTKQFTALAATLGFGKLIGGNAFVGDQAVDGFLAARRRPILLPAGPVKAAAKVSRCAWIGNAAGTTELLLPADAQPGYELTAVAAGVGDPGVTMVVKVPAGHRAAFGAKVADDSHPVVLSPGSSMTLLYGLDKLWFVTSSVGANVVR